MIGHFLAGGVRLFTGAQARWVGCGPISDRPRIYFANHVSNLDFVLIWSALPKPVRQRTRPAAAHDYWSATPFKKRIAEDWFNAVLIERKKVTRENHPIERLCEVLRRGESIIIFPEGTRNPDPAAPMGEFKSGLHHLMQRCPEAELVPVYLQNLNRVLPKGEWLPVPMLCSASFGSPLEKLEGETKPEFLARARDAVTHLIPT